MLVPSIFQDNFFNRFMNHSFVDNFFDDIFTNPFDLAVSATGLMNTDIKEDGGNYVIDMELPGYAKEDIHADLKNGYLTISANKQVDNNQNDENGKYIRRERYTGQCKRSFYVGDKMKEEDIHAQFENGILKLTFPKNNKSDEIENKKYIEIE